MITECSSSLIIFRTQIFPHVTIATDPDNIRFVFAAVKHTILNTILGEMFDSESVL